MQFQIKVSLHGGDFLSDKVFNDDQCNYKIFLSEIVECNGTSISCPICLQRVDIRSIKKQIKTKHTTANNK